MHYNFRAYNPKQSYLLPPSLDEWLPQNHLARFISEVIDNIDLSDFIRYYRPNGQGNAAYHPVMMVKILLYAYCVGIPSSRKIAKALIDDVAFRWLAAGNFPDFRTISEFRKRHLKALMNLFPRVLLLCKEAGLVKAGIIALDGTKVKANASIEKNRTYESLREEEKELREKAEELLNSAELIDEEEDRKYGDKRGDELPEDLNTVKKRIKKIAEAKRILEEREKLESNKKGESFGESGVNPGAKINMTDPDSRIQKTSKGYIQGYNAQAVVTEDQVIVACDVVEEANDVHQFIPMVEKAKEALRGIEDEPETVLADAGYCTEANLAYADAQEDIECLIATGKESKIGKESSSKRRIKSKRRKQMARALKKPVNRFIYGFRKFMVEPVFGQIKRCQGLEEFLLRGLNKVKGEFTLWCITHNILKLYRGTMDKTATMA